MSLPTESPRCLGSRLTFFLAVMVCLASLHFLAAARPFAIAALTCVFAIQALRLSPNAHVPIRRKRCFRDQSLQWW